MSPKNMYNMYYLLMEMLKLIVAKMTYLILSITKYQFSLKLA